MTNEGVTIEIIDDPNQVTVNVESEDAITVDVVGGEKGDIGPQGTIYRPTTEPEIVTGTPDTLTLDIAGYNQAMFEPNLSSSVRSINVDHSVILSNDENCDLFSIFYRLTGTRVIEFPSNVKVSIASTIGIWDDLAKTLTLGAGIDDNILMIAQKNRIEDFYDLSVNEISL